MIEVDKSLLLCTITMAQVDDFYDEKIITGFFIERVYW